MNLMQASADRDPLSTMLTRLGSLFAHDLAADHLVAGMVSVAVAVALGERVAMSMTVTVAVV